MTDKTTEQAQTATFYCRSWGGSDYCRHCGKDMCTADGKPRICVQLVPDAAILAFGCYRENYMRERKMEGASPCNKWCRSSGCTFSIRERTAHV